MLKLGDKIFSSRFLLGTAQYPSLQIMQEAIMASHAEIITVSLKRQAFNKQTSVQYKKIKPRDDGIESNEFWKYVKDLNRTLLPNTAGCHTANDAVTTAEMAQEIFATHWIKLEVIGDDYTLQPDPFEVIKAAKILVQKGFEVFPYCTDDLVLCQRLVDCGCRILMPWAAPIGSGKGILNPYAFETLRARLPDTKIIIDAGIGKPSHAVQAMELGCDGILLNTAVSRARDPIKMASAFRDGIIAGRNAFEAGMMLEKNMAQPSTPLLDTPFWHQV